MVGWSINQTDRQTDKETVFSRVRLTDSTVNPLVCWFPASSSTRASVGIQAGGGGEVAKQFVGCLGP